jgi:hypothetical protein
MTPSPPLADLEQVPAEEADGIRALQAISEQQMLAKSHNPTLRDQHPKSHGYAEGSFSVEPDLPAAYRPGVFAAPATHACWVRWSNGSAGEPGADGRMVFPPDAQRDGDQIRVTMDVRGLAIKNLGVQGDPLPEAGGQAGGRG